MVQPATAPAAVPPEVVPYEARHREGVRALLAAAYGTAASFDRYEGGNPLGTFLGICALRGDRVVGFNIWNPWLVHTPLGPIDVHQSGASIVDESCRGQGVFGRLLRAGEQEARTRGIKYFIGFPNPASHGSFVRAGWETVRSMPLYVCTSPAVGVRVAPAGAHDDSRTWRFIDWRYARANVSALSAEVRGARYTLYFSTTSRKGLKVHRVLEVVNSEGQRDMRVVPQLARHLPAPGAVYFRVSAAQSRDLPSVPWAIPVRRDWDTPFIVKVLDGSKPAEADAVRGALLAYGDIDVG